MTTRTLPTRVLLGSWLLGALLAPIALGADRASKAPEVYPVAILTFQERGSGAAGYGQKATDIVFASLAARPRLYLVERADLKKLMEEQELNLSGMVAAGKTTRIGQLTGAKILVTGSVVEADDRLYLVAKIISTETGRVLGASVKGLAGDGLAPLAEKLAAQIETTLAKQGAQLVPKEAKRQDRIKALAAKIGKAGRPTVVVRITERHVGQPTIDPAAETELTLCCKQCGFTVLDSRKGSQTGADVVFSGEGFSEFAGRCGSLVSVKARLEVKATDRATGKVLATDRQVTVVVDLAEQVAGKKALQEAALKIAQRMLPSVVAEWNQGRPKKK